jgi:predicted DNA-binding transcriptional regulator YafY
VRAFRPFARSGPRATLEGMAGRKRTSPKAKKLGRKPGKSTQMRRGLHIIEALRLSRLGLTLADLAERFNVTEKTVQRDLDVLEAEGHAFRRVPQSDGPQRILLLDVPLKPLQLSLRERYSLLAVRRVFDALEHTPLHEDVRSVFAKIVQSMPVERRKELESFEERFVFLPDAGLKSYEDKHEVLDALLSGVLYRARVAYVYRNAQGKTHGAELEPYSLVLYRQGLYVVGRRVDQPKARVFAVERFVEATYRRGQSFEVPADFRVERFFEGAFGIFQGGQPTRVVIQFAASAAEAVRARVVHPTQQLVETEDGGLVLHMEVENLQQVLPWVLSWGAAARVLEPASLRAQVEDTARALLERPGLAQARPRRTLGSERPAV